MYMNGVVLLDLDDIWKIKFVFLDCELVAYVWFILFVVFMEKKKKKSGFGQRGEKSIFK